MTYKELVVELSHELALPRREVYRILRGLTAVVRRHLIAGYPVSIRELGRFQRVIVAPRGPQRWGGKKARPANAISFKTARMFLDLMRR